jgi:alanine or glycine:cation symporter, AGCS family
LVLLSSGVWTQKYDNKFQEADLLFLSTTYSENSAEDVEKLHLFLIGKTNIDFYTGSFNVANGVIQNPHTIMHSRSVAEEVKVWMNNQPFTGQIDVNNGKLVSKAGLNLSGKSLLHSAPLTTIAFTKSWFGDYGKYIVAVGLLLFAFSTAISWSYYGDRAVTYLFGSGKVIYYHIIYVIGFFLASFTDTTIIWTLSGITIALMTIPNLFGILITFKRNEKRGETVLERIRRQIIQGEKVA